MDRDGSGWSWLFGKFYAITQRNPASNRLVVEVANLVANDRILDIGCGAGKALLLAAEKVGAENVAGVDPTAALAATARKRVPGAQIEVAVVEDLPFRDGAFTMVWSVSSFHHWEDAKAGLAETRRVLVAGGRLLVVEQRTRKDGRHGLSMDESRRLEETLNQLGFDDVSSREHKARWRTYVVVSARRPS